MEDFRQRAITNLKRLWEAREPRREVVWALMGDAAGTLEVPGQAGKVYCRLYGNTDLTVRAWNRVVSPTFDRRVDVEVIRQPGMPEDYIVLGLSSVGYGGYVDTGPPDWLIAHAETHERRPGGGSDVVNVYKRALTELRADAQATPNMTVYVSAGYYLTTEIEYFIGGNSPVFAAAPGGAQERYDFLYLDTDTDLLAIRAGTAAAPGMGEKPQPQANEVPIAWIKFTTETEITNSMVTDARITVVTMGAHGLVIAHALDPAAGVHTGALPEDDVTFDDAAGHDHQGAGDTGKKVTAAKVINVPAGGIVATDVQAAVAELDAEKAGIADDESISGDWNFNPGELGLPSGNAFPGAPDEGDIFYRADEDKLYIYTTSWVEVGAGAAVGGLAGIFWHVDGALAVGTEVGGARLLPQDMTFTKAYIYCKTTGTAGSTIADIHKNGVTIFTTQANRPTLLWNDPDKKAVTVAPDVVAGVEGDIMTIDTDQIATGVEDLIIVLLFEGGGAPAAADFALWDPDAPPETPSAYDDEFDDEAFDGVLWTEFDPAADITVAEVEEGLRLDAVTDPGDDWGGIYQAIPGGDFTITAKLSLRSILANYSNFGLVLWDDAANPAAGLYTLGIALENTGPNAAATRWTNYQAWNSVLGQITDYALPHIYVRIRRTSTTYSFDYSADGIGWVRIYSGSLVFTPDHFGIAIDNNNLGLTIRGVASFFRYKNSDVGIIGSLEGDRVDGWRT